MREILFRGKRLDTGKWAFGSYYYQKKCYGDDCDRHFIITSSEALGYDQALEYAEVDPATVGQFTGLLDKNGKRIFEGDICKVGNLIYKVVFEYSCWWFEILSNKHYCCPAFNSHCGDLCEVIGNIYDYELLEVNEDE